MMWMSKAIPPNLPAIPMIWARNCGVGWSQWLRWFDRNLRTLSSLILCLRTTMILLEGVDSVPLFVRLSRSREISVGRRLLSMPAWRLLFIRIAIMSSCRFPLYLGLITWCITSVAIWLWCTLCEVCGFRFFVANLWYPRLNYYFSGSPQIKTIPKYHTFQRNSIWYISTSLSKFNSIVGETRSYQNHGPIDVLYYGTGIKTGYLQRRTDGIQEGDPDTLHAIIR